MGRNKIALGIHIEHDRGASIVKDGILCAHINLAGDPIVESPRDAILTFLSTGIDLLVVENYLVDKNLNQSRILFKIKPIRALQ